MNFIEKRISSSQKKRYLQTKSLILMRLFVVFLMMCTLQSFTSKNYSQTVRISLEMNNATVKEVLSEIERKSEFYFTYNLEEINTSKKTTISVKNKDVTEVLNQVFEKQNIAYTINDKHIVLHKANSKDQAAKSVSQNTKKVAGKIVDVNGETIIGVSVLVKGKSYGTTTDIDGNFSLNMSPDQTLVISYVGYITQEIAIGNKSWLDIVLRENDTVLDEVVVVGYGVQKKVNLTGAVSYIKFDDKLNSRPLTSVSSALSGLIPGVGVSQSSGQPGSSATIRVRGTGTLNNSNPLVLVDGVEWSMDAVNPNDIESISVLKDASSTAIYGSLGANGVILITTKKGKGKPMVNYNGYVSVQNAVNKLSLVSDYANFMELANETATNTELVPYYSQSTIEQWRQAKLNPMETNEFGVPNYMAYPNTDWFDTIFKTGISNHHHLSIGGSSEKINYSVAVGYIDNPGIMNQMGINSGQKEITIQSRVEGKISDWLTIGANVYGAKDDLGVANVNDAFGYMTKSVPGIYPGERGKYGIPASAEESTTANNILTYLDRSGKDVRYNATLSGYFVADIIKGLQVEGKYNYQIYRRDLHRWSNGFDTKWNYVKDEVVEESSLARATISNQTDKSDRVNVDLIARYNTKFGEDHDFGALVGYSNSIYKYESFNASKMGLSSWLLTELGTATTMNSIGSSSTDWRMESYFGRLNYAYKGKYLAEANVRYDGSSRFSPDSRWGLFPSFSLGWRITEEAFMKNTSDYLSNLKLRISYGEVGNNRTSDYAWQATYATANVIMDGKQTSGLIMKKIGNNSLEWESTKSMNIGLDFGFFNNRLSGEIDYYDKKTTGILYTPSLYLTMGNKTGSTENIAELDNKGFELNLKWEDNVKGFQYAIGGNFSYNTNVVSKYKGKVEKYWDESGKFVNNFSEVTEGGFGGRIAEGYQIGETYLHKIYRGTGNYDMSGTMDVNAGPKDGIIRTEQDMAWVKMMLAAGNKFNGVTSVKKDQLWYGDIIYQDTNGDGNYGDSNDQDFTGHSSTPKFNFGFNLSASYKNFDFYALLSGAAGFYLYWQNAPSFIPGYNTYQFLADSHYYYDPTNPEDLRTDINAKYPRLGGKNTGAGSDFWEYKGDYLKLKNIQLGYTLPKNITSKAKIERMRFYLSADNICTWTEFPGMDPEIGTSVTYPLMKQYAFGLQLTF